MEIKLEGKCLIYVFVVYEMVEECVMIKEVIVCFVFVVVVYEIVFE